MERGKGKKRWRLENTVGDGDNGDDEEAGIT